MKSAIEPEIRQFIEENFMYRADRTELSANEFLLDAGVVDLTGILELITFLETRFQIQVADADIVPEKLDSIRTIVAYVESMLAGT